MAAITPTQVREVSGLVSAQLVGTTTKRYSVIEIVATTTATNNTYDITNAIEASGIVGPLLETVDEAVAATASTWSSTTVTFAGHTGSGRYRGLFLIEQ